MAMSKCRNMPRTWLDGYIWIHGGERVVTASACEAFSKDQHRTSQPKSRRDPGERCVTIPCAREHPGSPQALGWVACQYLLPVASLQREALGKE